MKGGFVAATIAALAASVSAGHHRHAHEQLFKRGSNSNGTDVCIPGCTTIYKTITGEPTRTLCRLRHCADPLITRNESGRHISYVIAAS